MKPAIASLVTLLLSTQVTMAGVDEFKNRLGSDRLAKLTTRLNALNHDIATRGILQSAGQLKPLLTGYEYGQFYDWDTYFENLYLSYYGVGDYCFNNAEAFFRLQRPDGFIQRAFGAKEWGTTQPFKPFLAQIVVLASRQRGDNYEWLRGSHYDALKKYLDRWFAYDTDHNGLPVWESADANGMDNQVSRAGKRGSYFCEGVDLAAYLHRELQTMAFIAGKLGHADDQAEFTRRAKSLADTVNALLWDEKDGFYYDRNEKTGQPIRVKSVVAFLTLWSGLATPERAKRLINEHLTNEKEFWLKYPVATYAATEPEFYQGTRHGECNWQGTAWIPTNYMIFQGLRRYGHANIARELADRTFRMVLEENANTREYFNSATGEGIGQNPFWGWSSLAYVMPLEMELNYDPTDPATPLQPWLLRELGVNPPR